jgi:hypothetical protein
MGLRDQAAADLVAIMSDTSNGFGWEVTVTAPTGASAVVVGFSTDIGLTIDPETGVAVSGRKASVSLPIASLTAAGLGLPKGIADTTSKPWQVRFADIHGTQQRFKVAETLPDRALGVVVCILEPYRA